MFETKKKERNRDRMFHKSWANKLKRRRQFFFLFSLRFIREDELKDLLTVRVEREFLILWSLNDKCRLLRFF